MPIYTDDQLQNIPFMPSAPNLPMQVPGGTPEAAAKAQQDVEMATQKEQSEHYVNYGQRLLEHGQNIYDYKNNINQTDESVLGVPRGPWAPGGASAGGSSYADKERQWRLQQGFVNNPELAQKALDEGARLDASRAAAQTSYLKLQELRGRFSSGGATGQSEATPSQALPFAGQALGDRNMTKGQLLARVNPIENELWQGLKDVTEHSSLSNITADDVVRRFGNIYKPSEILQALKTGRAPGSEIPAGGAWGANKPGFVGQPASPLPGRGADHVDQEGTKPPPRNPPGRLRPNIQAGFGGQGEGDVTNRTGMEEGDPNQLIPKAPEQVPAERKGQWTRGVQILFQHPESAAEFDKRFSPGMPGMAKRLLSKRPSGFDQ